jgi:hypothetical protein
VASARLRIVFRVTSTVGVEVAVAGPFEACVRVGGDEIRGCLADLPLDLLRRCEPVRVPGVYRRQRHMPGRWFSTTAGRFLEYESLLERDWMLLMDFDRDVEWMCEQPLRLRYLRDGLPASHVRDLLVWRQAGPELCDVKSEERLANPDFQAQVRNPSVNSRAYWSVAVGAAGCGRAGRAAGARSGGARQRAHDRRGGRSGWLSPATRAP